MHGHDLDGGTFGEGAGWCISQPRPGFSGRKYRKSLNNTALSFLN